MSLLRPPLGRKISSRRRPLEMRVALRGGLLCSWAGTPQALIRGHTARLCRRERGRPQVGARCPAIGGAVPECGERIGFNRFEPKVPQGVVERPNRLREVNRRCSGLLGKLLTVGSKDHRDVKVAGPGQSQKLQVDLA